MRYLNANVMRFACVLVFVWSLGISWSMAADSLATGLAAISTAPTLHIAVESAWKRQPEAAALDEREAAISAAQDLASGLTPDAGAVSLSSRNDSLNRHPGLQEHELEISTALWLPGQQSAQQQEALARREELQARRLALRWEIAGQVREAWWQIATARNANTLAQRKLETARSLAADVQRRFQAGDVSRVDANLAQSEAHSAQAELLDASAVLLQAEQAFQLLTGAQAIDAAVLEEELPRWAGDAASLAVSTPKIQQLTANHPLAIQADKSLQAARARAKLAEQSQRAAPELALRVVRERGGLNEAFVNSVGVRLKIPFSSGAQVRRDSATARADTIQTEFDLMRVRSLLQAQLQQALLAQQLVMQQIDLAAQNQKLANDNLQLAEKAYRLGESDLLGLLRARSNAFQAESFLTKQSLARAAAVSRVNQALGLLP